MPMTRKPRSKVVYGAQADKRYAAQYKWLWLFWVTSNTYSTQQAAESAIRYNEMPSRVLDRHPEN